MLADRLREEYETKREHSGDEYETKEEYSGGYDSPTPSIKSSHTASSPKQRSKMTFDRCKKLIEENGFDLTPDILQFIRLYTDDQRLELLANYNINTKRKRNDQAPTLSIPVPGATLNYSSADIDAANGYLNTTVPQPPVPDSDDDDAIHFDTSVATNPHLAYMPSALRRTTIITQHHFREQDTADFDLHRRHPHYCWFCEQAITDKAVERNPKYVGIKRYAAEARQSVDPHDYIRHIQMAYNMHLRNTEERAVDLPMRMQTIFDHFTWHDPTVRGLYDDVYRLNVKLISVLGSTMFIQEGGGLRVDPKELKMFLSVQDRLPKVVYMIERDKSSRVR